MKKIDMHKVEDLAKWDENEIAMYEDGLYDSFFEDGTGLDFYILTRLFISRKGSFKKYIRNRNI